MSSPIDVATKYLRSFTRNDPDEIARYVSDGFRNDHQSALGSSCVGRDEYRRRLPHFLDTFTDRNYLVEDIVEYPREAETDVVVRYRFTAVHTETDVTVEIPGVMWMSVRGDEVTRRIDTWDSLTFLQQIGEA